MQSNKLRFAIRATAAAAVMGAASQASAVTLNVGDDVEASLYGYARLNMSYDINDNRAVSTRAGSFTPGNEDVEGHFGADAQQSRVGINVKHASGVSVTVEGDFRGSGNSAGSLRLRHGYGEYMGVLAGRTWSNYNSFVGNTANLDFDGLAGAAGAQDRTEQVRYTSGPLSVSIEDPLSQTVAGDPTVIADPKNEDPYAASKKTRTSAPSFTARFESSAGAIAYSAAAVVNQITYDTGAADDSAFGYGVFGAAKFKVTDLISIQGALNYTDGASGYLWRSGSNYTGPSAYLDGDSLETIAGYGGTIGVSLGLGDGSSVNVGYGMTKLDLDDASKANAVADSAPEQNQNAMVNYMWTPVKNVMMGVQYTYLDQETYGGNSSDANRLMFAAQYSF